MTLFGAFWFEAVNAGEARVALAHLAEKLSDCTEYSEDLIAYGVGGDMAYTVGHERASMRVGGEAPCAPIPGDAGVPARGRRPEGHPPPCG